DFKMDEVSKITSISDMFDLYFSTKPILILLQKKTVYGFGLGGKK
ncbi:MAG: hypothetical protein UX15_C0023G0011, partial [Parcubacteria group bacterium GW2011_GWA1_45_7]